MSTKRNAGLHPESLSLLRSIENDNNNRRNSNADRAGKNASGTTLVKLFGGFGVASLAIASYVSGYKSTSKELLSLGENKSAKNKVVLHTGCSPVAQLLVDTFEVEDLADWGEVVGARVSIHGLTGHTMTHGGCGRYEIEQDEDVQFHHDGPFEFTLFANNPADEVSVKERNANVTMHMTECTKEFTYDGQKVMQRVFDRDGDRHFVFGSCDHHCPGFYEDVLTHYGTACPVDEKSAETVLPANSTEGSDAGKCSPGSFMNTNGECEECPIGTYTDERGSTTCKRCQPGQFNPFPEAQGCMACPDGYFQPNWGQQYCVACDGDAALGKKEFALQGASKRKLLGGWWGPAEDEDGEDAEDVEMNHEQYHKIGATSLDQCGAPAVQQSADEYEKTQEHENDPTFDATPGSSNEPVNDGPNGPAATPVLTGRTDKLGHCVCPGTKPKPKPVDDASGSSPSPTSSSSSSEVEVNPVTHVVAGQPCGPCAAVVTPTPETTTTTTTVEEEKKDEAKEDASTDVNSSPIEDSTETTNTNDDGDSTAPEVQDQTNQEPIENSAASEEEPTPTPEGPVTTGPASEGPGPEVDGNNNNNSDAPPQEQEEEEQKNDTTTTTVITTQEENDDAEQIPPHQPDGGDDNEGEQLPSATITSASTSAADAANTTLPAADTLTSGETVLEQETKTSTGSIINVETQYTADGEMIKVTTVTNPSGASATTVMHVENATLPLATCDEIEHGEFGVGYRGCQDKTRDGQQCIDWKDQYIADGEKPYTHSNYPLGIEENPGNMCRNPADDKSGIWCFTGTDGSWQVCSPLMQAEAD
ncbi:unnamed protein product [Bathycoccus prasinos]